MLLQLTPSSVAREVASVGPRRFPAPARLAVVPEVEVDAFNAFGVNRAGLERAPFPLSFSVVESEGLQCVHATAVRAYDVVDVLGAGADSTAVLLNIGQNSFFDDDFTSWRPRRIAEEQGVGCTAYDIGWAASSRFRCDDLLVMPWRDLRRFLKDWSLYAIDILDVRGRLDRDQADEIALVVNTYDLETRLLPLLPGSRVYYSGHDDCYLYAETTDPRVPVRLFTRLLALFAGSAVLARGGDDAGQPGMVTALGPSEAGHVTVPEPDESLVAALIGDHCHWAGTVEDARPDGTVTIGLVRRERPWRLADPIPPGAPVRITIDLETGQWQLKDPIPVQGQSRYASPPSP